MNSFCYLSFAFAKNCRASVFNCEKQRENFTMEVHCNETINVVVVVVMLRVWTNKQYQNKFLLVVGKENKNYALNMYFEYISFPLIVLYNFTFKPNKWMAIFGMQQKTVRLTVKWCQQKKTLLLTNDRKCNVALDVCSVTFYVFSPSCRNES